MARAAGLKLVAMGALKGALMGELGMWVLGAGCVTELVSGVSPN
jgi:hypothetical protein